MILGLSGTLGSGKDTISEYLIKRGFQHISLSDLLRKEMKKRGLKTDRDNLRNFSNQLEEDTLAKMATKLKKNNNLVLSSIRKPAEVNYLHTFPDFKLIFVDAPIELRYKRMKNRGRFDEVNMTLKELKQKEKLEMSGKSSQRLDYCKSRADFLIDNSKDLNYLYKQIERVLNAKTKE